MKKFAVKSFALVLALLMLTALFPLSALASDTGEETGGEGGHVCVYDQQNTADAYLAAAADCTSPALYFYSCVCGQAGTDTFSFGTALGHDFSVVVTALDPSCTEAGYSDHLKCSRCEETQGKTVLEPLGHDFSAAVPALDPSCTEAGYTAHLKCSRCEETQGKTALEPLGHDFSLVVTALDPTCTEAGYSAHLKCSRCDAVQGKETVDALGHAWGEDGVCTRPGCGAVNAEPPAQTRQLLGAAGDSVEPKAEDFTLTTYDETRVYKKHVGMPVPYVQTDSTYPGTYSYSKGEAPGTAAEDGIFSSPGHIPTRNLMDTWEDGTYTIYFNYTWEGTDKYFAIGTVNVVTTESVILHFNITGPGKVRFATEARDITSSSDVTVHVDGMYSFTMVPDTGDSPVIVKSLQLNGTERENKTDMVLIIRDTSLNNAQISVEFGPRAEDAQPGVAFTGVVTDEDFNGEEKLQEKMDADSAGKTGAKSLLLFVQPCWDGNSSDPMKDDEIPAEGITFKLPFPEGITAENRNSYDFFVYHYHEDLVDGAVVGSIETLPASAYSVTDEGIFVTLKSFSPVAVLALEADDPGDDPQSVTLTITPASAQSGDTLTAGSSAAVTDYQWLCDGQPITGATASTYRPKLADAGKTISCQAKDADGNTITSNSVVPTAAPAPAAPAVTKDRDVINDGITQWGRISGTSAEMEYAASPDAASWTPITGSSFSVAAPGTYYVRIKATDYTPASASASATVDAYYTISTRVLYGHGSIKPMKTLAAYGDSDYLVKAGDDVVFVFTGSLNYSVASVRVDGQDAGAPRTYTFRNVREPYELGVGFKYTGIGPRTGDGSRIELWCGAEALSLLGLLALALFLRRHGKARA